MNDPLLLRVDGEVVRPCELRYSDLQRIDSAYQIEDVGQFDARRQGRAVKLTGLLDLVQARPSVAYLGLHSSTDNFHASIPLAPVLQRAFLIYSLDGQPLDSKRGGPIRFFIPDFAACHTHEIDECANVKFVDHIEVTRGKGFDNRPQDEASHRELHSG